MAGCTAYLQLFLSWLLLNMITFLMVLIPHSVRIIGIMPNMDESDKFVVFGLWVLIEITIFFMLLVSATVFMCTCNKVPPGPGFIHLAVDPTFITLGCVPFLIICGLPKLIAIYTCLYAPISMIPSANGSAASAKVNCLALALADREHNSTLTAGEFQVVIDEFKDYLNYWICMLQGAIPVPVVLKLVRYRWKMSWQPFIHSSLYFFIQSIDIALLFSLVVHTASHPINIILQIVVYMSVLLLCLGCLGVVTPPIYLGNHTSTRYIKYTTYIGTIVFDLPFFILRCILLSNEYTQLHDVTLDGGFYMMLLKEIVSLSALMCIVCHRVSLCVGNTYSSLNVHDSECDEYDMNELEDYV